MVEAAHLAHNAVEVMVKLVLRGTDVSDTLSLVAWTTGTTKDLENIEDREVDKGTLTRIVHVGALDDDGVRWQIDTPRQSGRTAEDLDGVVLKHAFHHGTVRPQHACVVDTETVIEQLLHLAVARGANVAAVQLELGVVVVVEQVNRALLHGHFFQTLRSLDCLLARVNEDHDLVALAHELESLVEHNLFHITRLGSTARLALDTDKVLLEGDGTEGGIEEEQALVTVDAAGLAEISSVR